MKVRQWLPWGRGQRGREDRGWQYCLLLQLVVSRARQRVCAFCVCYTTA